MPLTDNRAAAILAVQHTRSVMVGSYCDAICSDHAQNDTMQQERISERKDTWMATTDELTVTAWVATLASAEPAPGGGAVAALAAALGAALVSMVARFTVDRPKYAAVQEEVAAILTQADDLRSRLLALVDADALAYGAVAAAFRMPKATEDERTARQAAIQSATNEATKVPLAIAAAAFDVARLAHAIAQRGNRSVLTDAGGAALFAEAALRAALLNVDVNLPILTDVTQVTAYTDQAQQLSGAMHGILDVTLAVIRTRQST